MTIISNEEIWFWCSILYLSIAMGFVAVLVVLFKLRNYMKKHQVVIVRAFWFEKEPGGEQ